MVREIGGKLEESNVMEAKGGRNDKKEGVIKSAKGCREVKQDWPLGWKVCIVFSKQVINDFFYFT